MQKIIIIVIAIIVVIAGYVFIKDQKIKKELSKVQEAQEVSGGDIAQKEIASSISANRLDGTWSIDSTGEYVVDAQSLKFEFTGYKPGGEHVGTFNTMSADIGIDSEGNPVRAQMSFEVGSVKTDASALDTHLQAADFFDAAVYPNISVNVKDIQYADESNGQVITEITMKGVTKTVSAPIKIEKSEGKTKFMIDTRVNIREFSIAYGPVLDEVRITAEGVVMKK